MVNPEFLAITAHEFRTPLTVILAYSQMLGRQLKKVPDLKPEMKEKFRESIDNIETQAHHLTNGIAGYWEASSITVESAGRVQVSAVCRAGRKVRVFRWEAKKSWYDRRRHEDSFFIYSPLDARSAPFDSPSPAEARATFGSPAATYQVAGDTVMVWHHNLLADLPPWPPWPASRLAGTLGAGALLG